MTRQFSDDPVTTTRLLTEADPEDTGTISFQYEGMVFTLGTILDLIDFGRALELKVEHQPGRGGWITRRGIIIAKGKVGHLKAFYRAARRVIDFD